MATDADLFSRASGEVSGVKDRRSKQHKQRHRSNNNYGPGPIASIKAAKMFRMISSRSPILKLSAVVLLLAPQYMYHHVAAEETAAEEDRPFSSATFDSLSPCTMTSLELSDLDSESQIDPCIVYDVVPPALEGEDGAKTTDISIVQVTPTGCKDHRDGAVTAVEKMNADNGGKGYAIGANGDHYVSVICVFCTLLLCLALLFPLVFLFSHDMIHVLASYMNTINTPRCAFDWLRSLPAIQPPAATMPMLPATPPS